MTGRNPGFLLSYGERQVYMNSKLIRTFDLFCGGGGSSRGAFLAGVTPVAALDMWDLAVDTYKLNFPTASVYQMKADSLSPKRLLKEVGCIDLMLASPACTGHSVAKGDKPGCELSRATAFNVVKFAKVLRPRWIVVENVLQMKYWHRFKEWYEELKSIGYNLDSGVLDAQYYGTPQSRRRFFIVGDLKANPVLPKPRKKTKRTVYSILGHGEPSEGETWNFSLLRKPKRAKATIKRARRAIKELGDGTPFIMVYYGTDGAGGFQSLNRPLRTITTLDRFAYLRKNGHGYEMRMLQPPELAAAMGFPDNHLWSETTRRNKVKLIGNAVCPPVMKAIIESLIKA